jgi:hypothetical protein
VENELQRPNEVSYISSSIDIEITDEITMISMAGET